MLEDREGLNERNSNDDCEVIDYCEPLDDSTDDYEMTDYDEILEEFGILGNRPIFVVDTNVPIDFIEILPMEGGKQPNEPMVNMEGGVLIIPTVVERELSHFKNESTERGYAAREFLRRLRKIEEGTPPNTMGGAYHLKHLIKVPGSNDLFVTVLPVHKNFRKCLPFNPSDRDMDGQVILAALAAAFVKRGLPIDGTADGVEDMDFSGDVTLLTNDNGLAVRARARGLNTSHYGYKFPPPYTGRRDIDVPREMLEELLNCRASNYEKAGVSREMFERLMPDEPELVANEFIVMGLAEGEPWPVGFDPENNPYFAHIGRYDVKEDAIVPLRYISDFPTAVNNAGQAIYAESLMNPEIAAVVCTGPAGSGKTYMATIFGYIACQDGDFIGVTVVPCENRSDIGALPGDLDEKMDPDVQPMKNALRNYLIHKDPKLRKELDELRKHGAVKKAKKNGNGNNNGNNGGMQNGDSDKRSIKTKLKDRVNQIWENWFTSVPIESARGRDFALELAIYDEFQDQNVKQADTLIKRIGAEGKIILTGDVWQIHAPYLTVDNNGLVYASRLLYDNPMVAQVHFTEDEVVRHPLVKMVAQRQKAASQKR